MTTYTSMAPPLRLPTPIYGRTVGLIRPSFCNIAPPRVLLVWEHEQRREDPAVSLPMLNSSFRSFFLLPSSPSLFFVFFLFLLVVPLCFLSFLSPSHLFVSFYALLSHPCVVSFLLSSLVYSWKTHDFGYRSHIGTTSATAGRPPPLAPGRRYLRVLGGPVQRARRPVAVEHLQP